MRLITFKLANRHTGMPSLRGKLEEGEAGRDHVRTNIRKAAKARGTMEEHDQLLSET